MKMHNIRELKIAILFQVIPGPHYSKGRREEDRERQKDTVCNLFMSVAVRESELLAANT